MRLLVSGNAWSAVGYANLDERSTAIARRRRKDADPVAVLGSIVDGVVEKVLQSVLQGHGVAQNQRKPGVDALFDHVASPFQDPVAGSHRVLDHGLNSQQLSLPDDATHLGAGESQNLLYDGRQFLRFLLDRRPVSFDLAGVVRHLALQVVGRVLITVSGVRSS